MNFRSIVLEASPVNQGILLVLFILSVLSWVVVVERWRYFAAARNSDHRFLVSLKGMLTGEAVHKLAMMQSHSPISQVYLAAEREVERLGRDDSETWAEALDLEKNILRTHGEKGLPLLAIVASASPFIGLMGTVWGVMIAFLKLGGMEGQPALEVVGPGIAEALIATAMGLFAAIPATIAYNAFGAAQRKLMRRSDEFIRRLVASIPKDGGFGR